MIDLNFTQNIIVRYPKESLLERDERAMEGRKKKERGKRGKKR